MWLLPIQAFAHPHIWVDTSLEILADSGEMTGVRVRWSFDELYSTSFLQEADSNSNKKLEKSEADKTIQAVFVQDQEALYPFMYIRPFGGEIGYSLKNPFIWMDGEYLKYQFDIVFDMPQPLNGHHEFGIYDPEFYVAFEQDLNMRLPASMSSCKQTLAENQNISIYMDMVNPETYKLICED